MKRYKIIHSTVYDFSGWVELLPHTARLRPREGHELRIESSRLDIFPEAALRWHRDVEGNSILVASFTEKTRTLSIMSEMLIQQYDQAPLDFLVADNAVNFPFRYSNNDSILLAAYMTPDQEACGSEMGNWMASLWRPGERVQSVTLLQRLNQRIFESMQYRQRDEEGVQSPLRTLELGSGSCRDFANLFMLSAKKLGFAARFVSGYVYPNNLYAQSGSTHAWAEVFIPGAGWKGFDPTNGCVVGDQHISVAVARLPETVPPVEGSYLGAPDAVMKISVWVENADR
jgi:transglutaminase-like putative cysteine protease